MSRPKEFDETKVLAQAIDLFRAQGFKATSFEDLTAALGVNRQSLYDTYGDKQALFQTALRRYLEHGLAGMRRHVDEPVPVRQAFANFFEALIRGTCDGGSHGCLMVNSMVELAHHDADTRALALTHAREVESMFASRLGAAQRAGEIDSDKDPVALARYLYHTVLGLAVAARALGERESLRQSAVMALHALG